MQAQIRAATSTQMDKFMFSLDSLAVSKSDLCSFASSLQAYQDKVHANGEAAFEIEIVPSYPDIEYRLARDISALFGFGFYCVSYQGTFPGFTDWRSIFVKNLERGSPYFRPVWTCAHELSHLFENFPQLHGPALNALKQLVSDEAWEARRAIEDDDIGTKMRVAFCGAQPVEIDRSPERQAYIWNEVMADCYASMWADASFWDGLKRLGTMGKRGQDIEAAIERLHAANSITPIISYLDRTWYSVENREEVRALMIRLTAAYLSRPHSTE